MTEPQAEPEPPKPTWRGEMAKARARQDARPAWQTGLISAVVVILVIVGVYVFLPRGGTTVPDRPPVTPIVTARAQNERVSAAEYGADWPLIVDGGLLTCEPINEVVLRASDGQIYGLNGSARGSGRWRDGLDILREGKTGADLSEFIKAGLALCE